MSLSAFHVTPTSSGVTSKLRGRLIASTDMSREDTLRALWSIVLGAGPFWWGLCVTSTVTIEAKEGVENEEPGAEMGSFAIEIL